MLPRNEMETLTTHIFTDTVLVRSLRLVFTIPQGEFHTLPENAEGYGVRTSEVL